MSDPEGVRPRRHVRATAQRSDGEDGSDLRALLDFGASGARAMLAAVRADRVEVLGYGAAAGDGRAVRRDYLRGLAETALSAAESETTRYRALPAIADVAIVGLSGPLLLVESFVLRLPRQTPEGPLDTGEVQAAFDRVNRQIRERIATAEAAERLPHRIIATELVGIAVERQPVTTLPGPTGSALAVAACGLAWPEAGLDLLMAVIADLDLELATVVPSFQAIARAAPVADAVLIDVGAHHTGIGLVEGRRLSHARAIVHGGAHFTASICSALSLSTRAATVAKHRYALGHGGSRGRQQVECALASGITTWLEALTEELDVVAGQAPLPDQVLLYGGGSRLSDLLVALRQHDWPDTLFGRTPAIDYLYPHQLRGLRDPYGALNSLDQVPIAALATWIAREPHVFEQMLHTSREK